MFVRLVLLFVSLFLVAGTPLAAGMGIDDARHLLARTGFGPTWAEIETYAALNRSEGGERLLEEARVAASQAPPDWVAVYPPRVKLKALPEDERRAYLKQRREQEQALRAWWLAEMRTTPSPLTERMTLFWHSHFTSALDKVKPPVLMYQQNALLRRHALGRFDSLLHAIAKDPAMLIYLDGTASRKQQPNENFAREVMELFTLGEGHYSETDIQEAARAFTGWTVDRTHGGVRFHPGRHDMGLKTLFGQPGLYDSDQVLDLLLQRPETAEHITRKLWREFISPEPDAETVKRLARDFRANHYSIKPLLRALLNAPAFWHPANRGLLIKSPVEFLIGLERQLALTPIEPQRAVKVSARLGQDLFNPPTVEGWSGGKTWLDAHTLLERQRIARSWSRPPSKTANAQACSQPAKATKRPAGLRICTWLDQFDTGGDWRGQAIRLLVPFAPLDKPSPELPPRQFVRAVLRDPVYQLK
ncbi:MAG: DUF1800 family protein [Gammaproteobacteria bacterium]|jgi:uncharacterized protein (DUF1800 family)|nr:DUF1800 family protein [Gammaproteobacteria bacterium]